MKNERFQYYVEGPDDKKVVDTLKTKMGLIKPGKVDVLNVVTEKITEMRLRTLSPGTTVVLVFDTDVGNRDILEMNLQILKKSNRVKDIILIPQVSKLEEELVRSCDIRQIKELLDSKTNEEFKRDVLRVTNLDAKLKQHKFDIKSFWSTIPAHPYQDIPNQSEKVKL